MKKIYHILIVALALFSAESCTQDKAALPNTIDCSTVDANTNTYALAIQPIMAGNCSYAGCHSTADAASNVILEGYAATKSSFETKPVLCTVKQMGGCSPMPQGSPKLADSLITKLQCWADNGYAQ